MNRETLNETAGSASRAAAVGTLTNGNEITAAVNEAVSQHGTGRDAAVPVLHALQRRLRHIPNEALERLCAVTDITPAQIEGVVSFYSQFRRMPAGKHLISVCHGTSCHVAGAEAVTESLRAHLGLTGATDTDSSGVFTLQSVGCLGCCSLAPVMRIDDRTYGHLSRDTAPRVLKRFLAEEGSGDVGRIATDIAERRIEGHGELAEIRIGMGSCCMAAGSAAARQALERELRRVGARAVIRCAGCVGMCHRVPLLEVKTGSGRTLRFGKVTPAGARAIVRQEIRPSGLLRAARGWALRVRDLLTDDNAWTGIDSLEVPAGDAAARAFLSRQRHIVLEGAGEMDPLNLDEYLARDGYEALKKAVTSMTPDQVIDAINVSGLRGRGGAGFPTGHKWAAVRRQPGREKIVIMNGDEGDPGAFMDRMMLESYPYRVLEGITIAAWAVGAGEGVLYIRAEYPLAVQRMREAIRQAGERGFLGERILGLDFRLALRIMEGAGAFVCGEETALLASVEGRRGIPRIRPPFPAQSGLWGRPTCINNVETYANVPWIIRSGPEAFAALGTPASRGTKVFALAGRVQRPGLIEVPMGITIREIVEEIGGGMREGRTFKAAQIGGPSGGCIPARLSSTRIDYEELTRIGAMMGSGGLVVMDDETCMVDIARYFLRFTQSESCGHCTFCRIGTKRMLEILDRLCEGAAKRTDVTLLEDLCGRVKNTSLCGLGRTAPNPVLTTMRFFRDEYDAHLEKRCPARKCRALISYVINDKCIGCTLCAQHCPADAIEIRPYEQQEIDLEKCVRCGTCRSVCPSDAVEVVDRNETDN